MVRREAEHFVKIHFLLFWWFFLKQKYIIVTKVLISLSVYSVHLIFDILKGTFPTDRLKSLLNFEIKVCVFIIKF